MEFLEPIAPFSLAQTGLMFSRPKIRLGLIPISLPSVFRRLLEDMDRFVSTIVMLYLSLSQNQKPNLIFSLGTGSAIISR